MIATDPAWENRLSELWISFDGFEAADFVARVDNLAAELPPGSPIALFERGAAQDSTGQPAHALSLYQAALAAGLMGPRRRRATIQMASSLRNLGHAGEAVAILTAELDATSDELDGAVRAFLALALSDLGREREALAISLTALAGYLPPVWSRPRSLRRAHRRRCQLTTLAPDRYSRPPNCCARTRSSG